MEVLYVVHVFIGEPTTDTAQQQFILPLVAGCCSSVRIDRLQHNIRAFHILLLCTICAAKLTTHSMLDGEWVVVEELRLFTEFSIKRTLRAFVHLQITFRHHVVDQVLLYRTRFHSPPTTHTSSLFGSRTDYQAPNYVDSGYCVYVRVVLFSWVSKQNKLSWDGVCTWCVATGNLGMYLDDFEEYLITSFPSIA